MSREIKYCSTSYAVQQELTVVCWCVWNGTTAVAHDAAEVAQTGDRDIRDLAREKRLRGDETSSAGRMLWMCGTVQLDCHRDSRMA